MVKTPWEVRVCPRANITATEKIVVMMGKGGCIAKKIAYTMFLLRIARISHLEDKNNGMNTEV